LVPLELDDFFFVFAVAFELDSFLLRRLFFLGTGVEELLEESSLLSSEDEDEDEEDEESLSELEESEESEKEDELEEAVEDSVSLPAGASKGVDWGATIAVGFGCLFK
jgi:hypothetical protein